MPFPPPSPSPPPTRVEIVVSAAGDVADYDEQEKELMKSVFADAANVDIDKVTLGVYSASVNIEVEIEVADATAGAQVANNLQTGVLSSPTALQAEMANQGVVLTVLAITPPSVVVPVVVVPGTQQPPPPPPPSPMPPPATATPGSGGASDDTGMLLIIAVAGGVVFALCIGMGFCMFQNKRQARPIFHPMRSPIASPRGGQGIKLRSPIASPRAIPKPSPSVFQTGLPEKRFQVEMTSSTVPPSRPEFKPTVIGDSSNDQVLV